MDLRQKTNFISALIIVISLFITVVLYVLFKIVFLFIIIVPSIIYYFLKKRTGHNGDPFNDRGNV